MNNYQSYVICTSPRSGSTLLCKLLAATGLSGKPESYFHRSTLDHWWDDLGLAMRRPEDERTTLQQLFREAKSQGEAGTGIFGLRLQRHSFAFFMEKLSTLHPGLENDKARFFAAFGKTLFIHLTRDDKLDQAISYVKAEQTGLWHQAPDGRELERLSDPQEPYYDPKQITERMQELIGLETAWLKWFKEQAIAPLVLRYDELSASPQTTLARVLKELGLNENLSSRVVPGVAKLADEVSQEWKQRYQLESTNEQGST